MACSLQEFKFEYKRSTDFTPHTNTPFFVAKDLKSPDGKDVLGVINLSEKESYTPWDIRFIEAIARIFSQGLKDVRAEEQLLAHTAEKENLVKDLQDALVKLKHNQDELIRAARFRDVGTLAAGAAHNFNNNLHGSDILKPHRTNKSMAIY